MTDKQIIEQRPTCLYQDTCLHLKEKTRLCKDCVHHKNYWSEVLVKDQAEKIKILNQECERLKNENKRLVGELANNVFDGFEELDQLKVENEKLATALKFRDSNIDAKNKEILKKCKNNRDLIDKNWKLIKTLDEIKEIVKCSCFLNCGKCPMDKKCKNYCDRDFNLQDIITQKISEVEDA